MRMTEKDLLALRRRQQAELVHPPEPPPVKPRKPSAEPPLSLAAAFQIYKVKLALAHLANVEADVAWAAYEALVAREEERGNG